MENIIPPTDTRRRPDQRALELGDFKLAAKEKERLEIKQRPLYLKLKSPSCRPQAPLKFLTIERLYAKWRVLADVAGLNCGVEKR